MPKKSRYLKGLIIGGTRSGKSDFAIKLSSSVKGTKAYLATAEPLDPEMRERIELHKRSRPGDWDTIEEPVRIYDRIGEISNEYNLILIDCLTLWLSNIMGRMNRDLVIKEIDRLAGQVKSASSNIVLVSNEVGMGIVPDNELARSFRDLSGLMNQKMADISSEVHLLFSGIPLRIK